MGAIDNLKEIDPWTIFWGIIALLVAVSYIFGLWGKTFGKLGIETKGMRRRREDRERLEANIILSKLTAENLDKLEKRHTKDEEEFRSNLNSYMAESRADRKALHEEITKSRTDRDEKIEKLTQMFLDKEIDDMRWEILNFCSALANGRKYNREAFGHVLNTYDKYEIILKENNMENGLVEQSMEFIKKAYQEGLKNNTIN